MSSFDKYASEYDSWFLNNRNVLESEVKLVASEHTATLPVPCCRWAAAAACSRK